MPKKTPYPKPQKRLHRGGWQTIWHWNSKQYCVATGFIKEEEIFAEQHRIEIAIALKSDYPAFPAHCADAPGVLRYIKDRYGISGTVSSFTPEAWLDDYEKELRSKVTENWAHHNITRLRHLSAHLEGLQNATGKALSQYLADLAATKKASTRNRILYTFTRFFTWLRDTERWKEDPTKGLKKLPEEKRIDIVYCTPEERSEIIDLARQTKWPEWIAVPIAFYTGMRCGEIERLEWQHIRFDSGTVQVTISKTKVGRTLPLHSALEKLLTDLPGSRTGLVVPSVDGRDRIWRLNTLVRKIRKAKRDSLLSSWKIERPAPSRAKDYKEKKREYQKARAVREKQIVAALERIGWNSFRHTFASLSVQANIEIDTVSSWMGNTPEVCRRHYAQFTPRDRRDHRIDSI